MQRLARIRILEPEDESTLSISERRIRRLLSIGYRLVVAIFVTAHLFDFLFSSVWMHGYIWSLNLPIDLDMSDKSAGAIVYHQLEQVGPIERLVLMTAKVLAIGLVMMCCGFASGKPQTVWKLFRMSICIGLLGGLLRPMQLKQRLFSSLHEGFYCFFITFCIGAILSVRPLERLPDANDAAVQEVTTNEKPFVRLKFFKANPMPYGYQHHAAHGNAKEKMLA
ncbi:hypothetical protein GCK32_009457 [Trichostrongylus colubriformis]|uniref:Uncharacterized protein n=1 Tax=Trichostrongylus colubriformis TaxID=6319 RepID=A0AAN8G5V0_TRICO